MADKIIVATFDDTNKAYIAAGSIKDLKDAGLTKFKLKSGVMVKKDKLGNVSLVEDRGNPFKGTVCGAAVGALIGLIGGLPAAAAGTLLGATSGLTGDALVGAINADSVDWITSQMRPGRTALIVEANEDSTTAVDGIVALGGGQVYRQAA